jgi:hypothetical protein
VTAAHNSSSTSVYLEWTPPPVNSLHGEFLGYLLSYRPRDASPTQAEEVRLADPGLKVSPQIYRKLEGERERESALS